MQPGDFERELNVLRNEIDELDSQLVELLVKRRKVTTKVGQLKSKAGRPIFDESREASLIQKRREQAEAAGLPANVIEDILRRLIRDSYQTQEAQGYRCVNPDAKNVVVIGGQGQLGQTFVKLFEKSSYQVDIIEKDDWATSESVLAKANLVIVAVPIRLTTSIIERLNNLSENCILADVTSVKSAPLQAMLDAHQGPVVGLHPMFGPDTSALIKQTIITCEGRKLEQYQWLLEQFEAWGANIYPVSAKDHDQAMSLVQVMRHFSTIAYGYHLMEEGADVTQLLDMSSPIYRLELIMVGRLFAQNPVLYTDIIFSNPENIEMMKRFAHRFLQLLDDVESGDKTAFTKMFNEVSSWFGDYADIFLQESKQLLLKAREVNKV